MLLHNFLLPYIGMLSGAAWNLQQNLDGLHLNSTGFLTFDGGGNLAGSYWSPGQAVLPIVAFLVVAWALLSVGLVVCGYVLGRKKGVMLAVLLLTMPGLLNLMSVWPSMPYLPDGYAIDKTGELGSPWGGSYLLVPLLLLGWVSGVLLMDALRIGDSFWNGFDHLWYAAGLVAIVFFLVDAQSGGRTAERDRLVREAQQASAFLHKQVLEYGKHCDEATAESRLSCEWASDVLETLTEYEAADALTFVEFGPHDSATLYNRFTESSSPSEIETIRSEISAYNARLCPIREINENVKRFARPSSVCQTTPITFCEAFPDPFRGVVDRDIVGATTALASECVIPTLVRLRRQQAANLSHMAKDSRNKHYRWFYYLFFTVIAGFKMSNSTMKLADLHNRLDPERHRAGDIMRRVVRGTWRVLSRSLTAVVRLGRVVVSCFWIAARSLARRCKEALRRPRRNA